MWSESLLRRTWWEISRVQISDSDSFRILFNMSNCIFCRNTSAGSLVLAGAPCSRTWWRSLSASVEVEIKHWIEKGEYSETWQNCRLLCNTPAWHLSNVTIWHLHCGTCASGTSADSEVPGGLPACLSCAEQGEVARYLASNLFAKRRAPSLCMFHGMATMTTNVLRITVLHESETTTSKVIQTVHLRSIGCELLVFVDEEAQRCCDPRKCHLTLLHGAQGYLQKSIQMGMGKRDAERWIVWQDADERIVVVVGAMVEAINILYDSCI